MTSAGAAPDLTAADQRTHRDAWADTGDGYTHEGGAVRCLWCSFQAAARTKREAAAVYAGHVQLVLGETVVEVDLPAAADVLGRAADERCPGCGRLLERRDWCFQCHYFDIVTGRAHYCGRSDCYCRALRSTMRRDVLDEFAEAFARRVLREEETGG